MKESKEEKVNRLKKWFTDKEIFYSEKANGHIQIDGTNFWCTTESWYDPNTGCKGKGLNSYMKYLHEASII